jgi:hypothetical protein
MSDFLTRLLDRNIHTERNVQPQLRGRFEPDGSFFEPDAYLGNLQKDSIGNDFNIKNNNTFLSEESEVSPIKNNAQPGNKLSQDALINAQIKPVRIKDEGIHDPENKQLNIKGQIVIPENKENSLNPVNGPDIFPDTRINMNIQDIDLKSTNNKNQQIIQKPLVDDPLLSQEYTVYKIHCDIIQGRFNPPKWTDSSNVPINKNINIKETDNKPESTIKVNIGRIEVKAIIQQNQTLKQINKPTKPKLSLDEYLKKKNDNT